jgi:hypothetical protein
VQPDYKLTRSPADCGAAKIQMLVEETAETVAFRVIKDKFALARL